MAGWRNWVALVVLSAGIFCQDSGPAGSTVTGWTLGNGLRVRLVTAPTPGEVAVLLSIQGAGALAEPPGLPHLAELTRCAILLAKRNEPADRLLVPRWMSAGSDSETTPSSMSFDIRPKPSEVRLALRVLANGFFDPEFDPATIERLKGEAREAVEFSESDQRMDPLGKVAWSPCKQIAFHSASIVRFKNVAPEVNATAVAAFIRRTFRTERAMLTVVGDFDPVATKRWVEESFGKTATGSRPVAESRPAMTGGQLRGSWDVASHRFFMMWPGAPFADRAYPALEILADEMSLRLASSPEVGVLLREETWPSVVADACGFLVVQAPLRAEKGGPLLAAEIAKLLEALAKDPLQALEQRKQTIRVESGTGALHVGAARLAPNAPLDSRMLVERRRMLFTLRCGEPPERYLARVDAVTADDIHAAIKAWLPPEKATILTIAGKE